MHRDRSKPRWPSELTEHQRRVATDRFHAIEPFLEAPYDRATTRAALIASKRSRRTLYRWITLYRRGGLVALAPKERITQMRWSRDPEIVALVRGCYLEPPSPEESDSLPQHGRRSTRAVWKKIRDLARAKKWKAPSYATVRRIIAEMDPAVRCLAREGDKAYADRYELVVRYEVDRPNERFHVDHSKLDILLNRPGQKPAHPWLTAVLDARSRALMGYHLGLIEPSALEVSLALRMAILPKKGVDWPMCGIPEEVFVDNGQDLVGKHMEQVAQNLKFDLVPSRNGPRHNAKLERFFGTLGTGLLSDLPGYTGPNVQKRPPNAQAKLSLADFEQLFRKWVVGTYHQERNRTTKESPLERYRRDFVPRLPGTTRELDLLLICETVPRGVYPEGIRLYTQTYISPELAPYVREKVAVRYDPRDLSEIQVYYRNRFICTAQAVDPDHPYADLESLRRIRAERRRQVREELKEYLRAVPPRGVPPPPMCIPANPGECGSSSPPFGKASAWGWCAEGLGWGRPSPPTGTRTGRSGRRTTGESCPRPGSPGKVWRIWRPIPPRLLGPSFGRSWPWWGRSPDRRRGGRG